MQKDQDLKRLDELIAGPGASSDAGRRSSGSCGLLLEHLRAARRALLGAMRDEYSLNLEQAKESLDCISDKSTRAQVKKTLQSLITSESPKKPASVAARDKGVPATPVLLAPAL